MSLFRKKVYFIVFLILFGVIVLTAPRGKTVVNTSISLAPDGKPVFNSIADKQSAFSSKDSPLVRYINNGVYGQSFEKLDYGVVAYYRLTYRFDLTNILTNVPSKFVFSADLPGEITEVKEGEHAGGKAQWLLETGQKKELWAKSRHVRWWLVLLSGAFFLLLIYMAALRLFGSKGKE